jgi:hypothetical protein
MGSEYAVANVFRRWWASTDPPRDGSDYTLLFEHSGSFVARSKAGLAAIVIPLEALEAAAIGRRASGCELVGHASIHFTYQGAEWDGPAAALLCTDVELQEAFAVLAADVSTRARPAITWQAIVTMVEEWQTLLAPRGRPSLEIEMGLWGELWFLDRSADIGRALAGWRGPGHEAADFFIDGVGVEVKAGRTERLHYVSQSQVEAPVGIHDAWVLSLWVKINPGSGVTVASLVDRILERAPDRALALRRIASAGYTPCDRGEYVAALTLMSEPEWYAASTVPRVRLADPGISHLRYRVSLTRERREGVAGSQRLWCHFHGQEYK